MSTDQTSTETSEDSPDRERELEAQVVALQTNIARLEAQSRVSDKPAPTPDMTAATRVAQLEQQLAAVKQDSVTLIPTVIAQEGLPSGSALDLETAAASSFDPALDGNEKPEWEPNKAIDGNQSTRWRVAEGDLEKAWLDIKFTQTATVTGIRLLTAAESYLCCTDMTVTFGDSAIHKLHLTPNQAKTMGWLYFPVPSVSTDRARIIFSTINQDSNKPYPTLSEVEVYGERNQ